MKKILLTLTALGLASSLANALAVDDKTFFSGAHLGMTIEECDAYYFPDGVIPRAIGAPALGGIPIGSGPPATTKTIATGGSTSWGGAPAGQRYVDFRNYDSHDWRVFVCYRESDGKIVLVDYWNVSEKISKEQISYLTDLNRPYGPLVTRLDNDEEFVITTPEQDKLEDEAIRPL